MPYSDVDYYKILGVTRHATDDEIKRAFRRLGRFFSWICLMIGIIN